MTIVSKKVEMLATGLILSAAFAGCGAASAQTPASPSAAAASLRTSPWTKFCGNEQDKSGKKVCLTVKEVRAASGEFLAGAALVESDDEKRLLRITLPLGMRMRDGVRVAIDDATPVKGDYVTCLANGCMADIEVDAAFLDRWKAGKTATLQGVVLSGKTVSYPLQLADFGKANGGTPTDPKLFESQQKKIQDEIRQRDASSAKSSKR